MKYKVLGVSSGLGVSLYPFKKYLIGNIEARKIFHTPKDEQWTANFGGIPLWKNYTDDINILPKGVDVIISSPDCGSGSIFRLSRAKKLGDHTKNDSLALFFTAVQIYKPKFFLFENLENLFKSYDHEAFRENLDNYRLVIHNCSVKWYGNSQINRKRLVIVGIRNDFINFKKYFGYPKHKPIIKTCEELYGDLGKENRDLGHIREEIGEIISIHARKRMSLWQIKKEWDTRLKGKKRWITEPGFNFTTAPGVYRNLDDSFPATARKANRQFNQAGYTLTPRELARVQGIPDTFKIYLDDTKTTKFWINKGRCLVTKTPPYEISVWFKKCLTKAFKRIEKNGR